MSTLGETIDAWALLPDTAQRLKDWLTSDGGWKLEDPPDKLLLTLTEADLQAAGFKFIRERREILENLKPKAGEHPVQVAFCRLSTL
jgi:hypothetical protein